MCNFSLGVMIGTIMGVGLILTVHPMNKRAMRKACNRAGKMANKMSHTIHDWT